MGVEQITEENLAQFYCSNEMFRHFTGIAYTDGIQFLNANGAGWLVDAIASYQCHAKVRNIEFQLWTLEVTNKKGVLTMREDTDLPAVVTQKIPDTDFPLAKIKIYVENQTICLPAER